MIIVTRQLIDFTQNIKHDIIADINMLEKLKEELSQIKKNTPITIYDLGVLDNRLQKEANIKDHINKTGTNPIIGSRNIEFKDIGKLYNTEKGIVTMCCGEKLNLNYSNPSHYLCVFSILAFYLGFNNIEAIIVNQKGY